MLLREIRNVFHKELDPRYPEQEVDSFFYRMLEHYLGLERFVLAIQPNLTLTKEEEQPLFEGLSALKMDRPIQYILGIAHFMEMDFTVNEHVLIPRPETEELVRWILEECQVERSRKLKILDIGTESGCIAVALAKNIPNSEVYALDISEKALEVAKLNATQNTTDIHFFQGDILTMDTLGLKFDVIVSNPPYVREMEKENINANVKNYEPGLALFVKDESPLMFYKKITFFARHNLSKDGLLFFEINQYLGEATKHLLEDQKFVDIELRKDIFGNDRMLRGRLR